VVQAQASREATERHGATEGRRAAGHRSEHRGIKLREIPGPRRVLEPRARLRLRFKRVHGYGCCFLSKPGDARLRIAIALGVTDFGRGQPGR